MGKSSDLSGGGVVAHARASCFSAAVIRATTSWVMACRSSATEDAVRGARAGAWASPRRISNHLGPFRTCASSSWTRSPRSLVACAVASLWRTVAVKTTLSSALKSSAMCSRASRWTTCADVPTSTRTTPRRSRVGFTPRTASRRAATEPSGRLRPSWVRDRPAPSAERAGRRRTPCCG